MDHTARQELSIKIGALIREHGGHVVSILPPGPGSHVTFEIVPARAGPLTSILTDLGYKVAFRGESHRLDPFGIKEEVAVDLGDGAKAIRHVSHAGPISVKVLEVMLPSDEQMLARHVRPSGPPKHRRRLDHEEATRARHRRWQA